MDTRTKNVSLEDLQRIVGEEHAREATSDEALDGVGPSFVAEPCSVEETSELLRFAAEEGLAVSPRGGGTKASLGNPPRELDLIPSSHSISAGFRPIGVAVSPSPMNGRPGLLGPVYEASMSALSRSN